MTRLSIARFCRVVPPFLVGVSLFAISCSHSIPGRSVPDSVRRISAEQVRTDVDILASDALLGRNTPSPQLDSAAAYIAHRLQTSGVAPVQGSYFARVPLNIISLGDENILQLVDSNRTTSFTLKDDFVPFDMTANRKVSGDVVFAGYGITAPEYGYDDYMNIDVKGKVVVVLRHEPRENDTSSAFAGERATAYSDVPQKVSAAIAHGAVAVLVATDPLNHASLVPRGFPWPSLSKVIPADALPITLAQEEEKKIPVVHIGEQVVAALFGSVDALARRQQDIDETMAPHSMPLHVKATVGTTTRAKDMSARNVVGMVAGSDPVLKHQVLVIGAHYDHVGFKKNHAAGEDYIFNGADDNASGSAALLSIAEAFGSSDAHPRRTVLFLFFAGEEKGLLGSASYVHSPLFPLDSTVAMLNLDMVGRNAPDTLYIIGRTRSPDLARIDEEENRSTGFVLDYSLERFLASSDQASFLTKGIPILFYNTGEHADYHKVSDNPDRIDADKAARVAQLAFRTAWRIANEDARYRVDPRPVPLF